MKPRGLLIAGNWKMNHGPMDTVRFFESMRSLWTDAHQRRGVRLALAVPAVSLKVATETLAVEFNVTIAAQSAHWEKSGAFTGELSGALIQEVGAKAVLVGHSERRQFFGETDESAGKRTESLLAQGLQVIGCFGETRAERESGRTFAVLERQLKGLVTAKSAPYLDGRLVLAYEPVWAIGTGLTATPEQAQEAHAWIRAYLTQTFGAEAAAKTSLLYGGSVTPENASQLLAQTDIDGALVGGASLKADSYLKIVATAGTLV